MSFAGRFALIPPRASTCLRLTQCRVLLRSPAGMSYFLGERVQDQTEGDRVVPAHPPVDMRFGSHIVV